MVDGLARVPKKDVASCDKPGVGARSHRTRDFLMGLPNLRVACDASGDAVN